MARSMRRRGGHARGRSRRGALVALVVLGLVVLGLGVLAYRLLSSPSLAPYAALELKTPAPPGPGVRVRFFGVATVLIEDGTTAVMTDGFFSRPGFVPVVLLKVAPDPGRIDAALRKGHVSKLAAVLVAHSHYDHALDAPAVAARTGAMLVGSESTANIGRGQGLPNQRIRVVRDGDVLALGGFSVRVFESPHSPNALYPGVIPEPLRTPAKAGDFKEGGNYSFLLTHERGTILVHPSANFVPGIFRGVRADVVFLGVGVLGKQSEQFVRDYWREVVQATRPRLVIPIHWDDFLRPLDEPLRPMPHVMDDFDRCMRILTALAEADGIPLRFLPAFQPLDPFAPGS